MSSAARSMNVVWHVADDEMQWIGAAVGALERVLGKSLATAAHAHLLLSGGSTPAPVYRVLGTRPLDWWKVDVGLVDDRDVGSDADGSNARLVRESLLAGGAGAARFIALRDQGDTLAAAVAAANARWAVQRYDVAHRVVVLGMGDDGHTASLFPGARNLDAAFASSDAYVAIDATGCKVAGAFAHRISMTPTAVAATATRMLLIRGNDKRAVLERALADGDPRAMPIRVVLDLADAPLHVFWCP